MKVENEQRILHSKKKAGVSSILYVAFCSFYISGLSSELHNYIQVGLYLAWLFVAMLEDRYAFKYSIQNKSNYLLLLFLAFYVFTGVLSGSAWNLITYVIVFVMLYGAFIPANYYLYRGRKKEVLFIVRTIAFVWGLFALNAILFYSVNPSAARTLAADFYAYDSIAIGGGYAIAFGSALLAVYLVDLLLNVKVKRRQKTWCIIGIVLLLYLLIKTESTTTLIACVLGIIVSFTRRFIKRHSYSGTGKFFSYALVLLLGIFIYANINTIGGMMLANTTDTDQLLTRRFNRIGEKLFYAGSSTSSENYVDERWGYVLLSFNTFAENPLLGIGYQSGYDYGIMERSGVGMHSEIGDTLAQYGLIGSIIWFSMIIVTLKRMSDKKVGRSYIVSLLLMSLLNPFRYFHGFFILFSFIPLMNALLRKEQVYTSSNGGK